MWTTVLVLAIAVNFEPTRIGLVPLMLSRQRPVLQLVAYLCGNVTMTLTFGLLVLFVFERSPLGTSSSSGGRAQIIIGAIAIAVATVILLKTLRTRVRSRRATANNVQPAGVPGNSRAADKVTKIVRGLFASIAKRILEMDTLTGRIIMTGGVVAYNPIVAELLSAQTGTEVQTAPHPQEMGAFGAALYAGERKESG